MTRGASQAVQHCTAERLKRPPCPTMPLQVTRRWWNWEGLPVARHLAQQLGDLDDMAHRLASAAARRSSESSGGRAIRAGSRGEPQAERTGRTGERLQDNSLRRQRSTSLPRDMP